MLHAGAYVGGAGPKQEGRANVRHFLERVRQITGAFPPVGWSAKADALRRQLAAVVDFGEPALQHPSPWSAPDGDVWAWPMKNLRRLPEPIAARGGTGFWPLPPEIASGIRATMGLS